MDKGKVKELFIEASKQVNVIGFCIFVSMAITLLFGIAAGGADSIRETRIIGISGAILVVVCWSIIAIKCLSIQDALKQIGNHFGEE